MTGNTTTELARRANDGVEVSLVWSRADGHLTVIVCDVRTGDSFELAARSDNALDVFHTRLRTRLSTASTSRLGLSLVPASKRSRPELYRRSRVCDACQSRPIAWKPAADRSMRPSSPRTAPSARSANGSRYVPG